MAAKSIDIAGGESVYCINQTQLKKALEMVHDDPGSAEKLQDYLNRLETELSRNERAALAFVIIQNLLDDK